MSITEEQKQFLQENNYVVVDNFISDKDCDYIKEYVDNKVKLNDYFINFTCEPKNTDFFKIVDETEEVIDQKLHKFTIEDPSSDGKRSTNLHMEIFASKNWAEEKIQKHLGIGFDELYNIVKNEYSYMNYYEVLMVPGVEGFDQSLKEKIHQLVWLVYRDGVKDIPFDMLNPFDERLQLYSSGGHIKEHNDGGNGRQYSFSISLGDKEGEGGVLRCGGDIPHMHSGVDEYESKKGRCVIKNADRNLHEVTPPIDWVRYSYIIFCSEKI